MTDSGEITPHTITTTRPDPSSLTTEAFARATEQWRRELAAAVETINTRFDAMDEASALKLDLIREIRPQTEKLIEHLRALHEVKFAAIDQRFVERDTRTDQAALASKQALDAALQAAKELVQQQNDAASAAAAVMIANFTKLIDQLGIRLESLQKSYDDRLTEIKERIDRGEGSHQGAVETRTVIAETATAKRGEAGLQWQTVGALIGAFGLLLAVLLAISRLKTGTG